MNTKLAQNVPTLDEVRNFIRDYLRYRKMNVSVLADHSSISANTIHAILSKRHKSPRYNTIYKLLLTIRLMETEINKMEDRTHQAALTNDDPEEEVTND